MKIVPHIDSFELIPETDQDREFLFHWLTKTPFVFVAPNPQQDNQWILKGVDIYGKDQKSFKTSYPVPQETLDEIVSLAKSVRPNEIEVAVRWRREDIR